MSVQNEISRLITAKNDLKTALNNLECAITDETLDAYAAIIDANVQVATDTEIKTYLGVE